MSTNNNRTKTAAANIRNGYNGTNEYNLAVKDLTGKTSLVPYTPYKTTVSMIKSYIAREKNTLIGNIRLILYGKELKDTDQLNLLNNHDDLIVEIKKQTNRTNPNITSDSGVSSHPQRSPPPTQYTNIRNLLSQTDINNFCRSPLDVNGIFDIGHCNPNKCLDFRNFLNSSFKNKHIEYSFNAPFLLPSKLQEFKRTFYGKVNNPNLKSISKITAIETSAYLNIDKFITKEQLGNNPNRAVALTYMLECFHVEYYLIYSKIIFQNYTIITSIISYSISDKILTIDLLLSDLLIRSNISHVQYLLNILSNRGLTIRLNCISHNCIYYARLGFKYDTNSEDDEKYLIYEPRNKTDSNDGSGGGGGGGGGGGNKNNYNIRPPVLKKQITISNRNIKNAKHPSGIITVYYPTNRLHLIHLSSSSLSPVASLTALQYNSVVNLNNRLHSYLANASSASAEASSSLPSATQQQPNQKRNVLFNRSSNELSKRGGNYINNMQNMYIKNYSKRRIRLSTTGKKYIIIDGKRKYNFD